MMETLLLLREHFGDNHKRDTLLALYAQCEEDKARVAYLRMIPCACAARDAKALEREIDITQAILKRLSPRG